MKLCWTSDWCIDRECGRLLWMMLYTVIIGYLIPLERRWRTIGHRYSMIKNVQCYKINASYYIQQADCASSSIVLDLATIFDIEGRKKNSINRHIRIAPSIQRTLTSVNELHKLNLYLVINEWAESENEHDYHTRLPEWHWVAGSPYCFGRGNIIHYNIPFPFPKLTVKYPP